MSDAVVISRPPIGEALEAMDRLLSCHHRPDLHVHRCGSKDNSASQRRCPHSPLVVLFPDRLGNLLGNSESEGMERPNPRDLPPVGVLGLSRRGATLLAVGAVLALLFIYTFLRDSWLQAP